MAKLFDIGSKIYTKKLNGNKNINGQMDKVSYRADVLVLKERKRHISTYLLQPDLRTNKPGNSNTKCTLVLDPFQKI